MLQLKQAVREIYQTDTSPLDFYITELIYDVTTDDFDENLYDLSAADTVKLLVRYPDNTSQSYDMAKINAVSGHAQVDNADISSKIGNCYCQIEVVTGSKITYTDVVKLKVLGKIEVT